MEYIKSAPGPKLTSATHLETIVRTLEEKNGKRNIEEILAAAEDYRHSPASEKLANYLPPGLSGLWLIARGIYHYFFHSPDKAQDAKIVVNAVLFSPIDPDDNKIKIDSFAIYDLPRNKIRIEDTRDGRFYDIPGSIQEKRTNWAQCIRQQKASDDKSIKDAIESWQNTSATYYTSAQMKSQSALHSYQKITNQELIQRWKSLLSVQNSSQNRKKITKDGVPQFPETLKLQENGNNNSLNQEIQAELQQGFALRNLQGNQNEIGDKGAALADDNNAMFVEPAEGKNNVQKPENHSSRASNQQEEQESIVLRTTNSSDLVQIEVEQPSYSASEALSKDEQAENGQAEQTVEIASTSDSNVAQHSPQKLSPRSNAEKSESDVEEVASAESIEGQSEGEELKIRPQQTYVVNKPTKGKEKSADDILRELIEQGNKKVSQETNNKSSDEVGEHRKPASKEGLEARTTVTQLPPTEVGGLAQPGQTTEVVKSPRLNAHESKNLRSPSEDGGFYQGHGNNSNNAKPTAPPYSPLIVKPIPGLTPQKTNSDLSRRLDFLNLDVGRSSPSANPIPDSPTQKTNSDRSGQLNFLNLEENYSPTKKKLKQSSFNISSSEVINNKSSIDQPYSSTYNLKPIPGFTPKKEESKEVKEVKQRLVYAENEKETDEI